TSRGGLPPGRCHPRTSAPPPARRSSRWLPANPAAPVTRMSLGIVWRALPRHAAHCAVERGEVAEAGERERQKKAAVRGNWRHRRVAVIVRLVFEGQPAALRVVERRDPLLHEAR